MVREGPKGVWSVPSCSNCYRVMPLPLRSSSAALWLGIQGWPLKPFDGTLIRDKQHRSSVEFFVDTSQEYGGGGGGEKNPSPIFTHGPSFHLQAATGHQSAPHMHVLVCICSNVRQFL